MTGDAGDVGVSGTRADAVELAGGGRMGCRAVLARERAMSCRSLGERVGNTPTAVPACTTDAEDDDEDDEDDGDEVAAAVLVLPAAGSASPCVVSATRKGKQRLWRDGGGVR